MVKYNSNEVSLCKKDVCLKLNGEMANAIAGVIFLTVGTICLIEIAKSLK